MSKNRKYKAVIIGCGNIGALLEADPLRPKPATYAGAFLTHPDIHLAGFIDCSAGALRQARSLFPSAAAYENAEKCLKQEQPDIVAIATPPATHFRYLKMCQKYDVDAVICEKPVSDSLAEAIKMSRLEADKKMIILVNYQRRFFESFRRARKKIQLGKLGKIRQITAYYSNGIHNNGSHVIDTLRFLLQDKIVAVTGAINSNNSTHPKGDYNVDGMLFFQRGAVATIQSFDQNTYGIHEIRLLGDKGALFINHYGFDFHWIPVRASHFFTGISELDYSAQDKELKKIGMVKGVVDHLVACLSGIEKPLCTIRDATKNLVVLSALVSSAKRGGRRIVIKRSKYY